MARDPIALFRRWYADAVRKKAALPEACALATADRRGRPSCRFVLFKTADARGFSFYSHRGSAKGRDLAANPRAALAFFWDAADRQVRIEGRVVPVPRGEADAYWVTRERASQIGAWASKQSDAMPSRRFLLAQIAKVVRRFHGRPVPRPPGWVGYRLVPSRIEFWRRGSFRWHRRDEARRTSRGWRWRLLQP